MDSNEQRTSQYVRRLQLPSGKTIEVVHIGDVIEPDVDLHLCRACGSQLVYPMDWNEAADRAWEVTLRCPECEEIREGTFSEEVIEAFDEQLDVGTDALIHDLERLTHANLAEEAQRFAGALAADAILPEDF